MGMYSIADALAVQLAPGIRERQSRPRFLTALRDGVPLSASRYLKTPRVFGYHGVYRTLARELRIETLDRLGETGYEIVSA